MPGGKPAGERCVQLDNDNRCRIFGLPERPAACLAFQPARWICGDSNVQALQLIHQLEADTAES